VNIVATGQIQVVRLGERPNHGASLIARDLRTLNVWPLMSPAAQHGEDGNISDNRAREKNGDKAHPVRSQRPTGKNFKPSPGYTDNAKRWDAAVTAPKPFWFCPQRCGHGEKSGLPALCDAPVAGRKPGGPRVSGICCATVARVLSRGAGLARHNSRRSAAQGVVVGSFLSDSGCSI